LCGEVRYECEEELAGAHCHRIDCRKTSGTGHCSHMIVPETIYSTNSEMTGVVFVRASSLDDPEAFEPQMVAYTDRAASWDHMDSSSDNRTRALLAPHRNPSLH
ncbi:MAG: hypothetical protein V3V97_20955, partial [Hyphomicrobiaceae bacterium]